MSQEQILDNNNRPSLYEAAFKPNSGIDIAVQLPNAPIHQGLLSSTSEFQEKIISGITKSYLNKELYGERAIVLHNTLTPEECLQISSITDQIEMKDANKDHRYRNTMRSEIASIPLAKILFERVKPFVESKKIVSNENVENFLQRELMIGEWKLTGLNDHFRLCYYLGENKGHFGVHYDGEHHPSQDVCSIKTCMFYLNDDYEGGETNFLTEHNLYYDEEKKIYCSPPGTIVASLKAKQGDCIIFDHKILHEGTQVLTNKKFIFRSELMYQRTSDLGLTEAQKKGRDLLTQARYFEDNNQFDEAVKMYRAAFKICPELERMV